MDCFAARGEAQCTSYLTLEQDALSRTWDPRGVLWMNPPWPLWEKAARKLLGTSCTAICVLPAWKAGWVRELVHTATRRLYVEEGTRLFECGGRKCRGTRWGTWVLRIDGDVRPHLSEVQAYNTVFLPRWRPQKPDGENRGGVGGQNSTVPKGTQTGELLRVLDLFSGTGTVGRVFADEGYGVIYLDIDPRS